MEKFTLSAKKRTIVGRKVKTLRKQNLLPGNIYGNKIKSKAIEIKLSDFHKVYHRAGETKIVELVLDEKDRLPVLIHNVQIEPLSHKFLHADFYQVDLTKKVKAKVSIELTGDSPAVSQKLGLLLQTLNEVEVEALPSDLPEKLTINVSSLAKVDQELKVADLKVPKNVMVLTPADLSVVKVGKLISKEAEQLAKEEEAAAAAAKAAVAAETAAAAPAPAEEEEEKPTVPLEATSKPETPTSP